MKSIEFYATGLEEVGEKEIEEFLAWAKKELEAEYPSHKVTVSRDEMRVENSWTDADNAEEIEEFCSRLWENFGKTQ